MATLLTKQNLTDIFDKILVQYTAVETAQNSMYDDLRDYNIDFVSHFSQKLNPSVYIPLFSSMKEFQETINNAVTDYSEFSRYPCYRNLFTALENYCKSDPALTDKTLNGFLYYNDMQVSDVFNRLYNGINSRFLQARNVLPPPNFVIYKTVVVNLALVNDTSVTPAASVFNNDSYSPTAADGKTYAPFTIKIVPNADCWGIKFTITFSDNTTETLDCLLEANKIPVAGIDLPSDHSGIKSISVDSRTMSDILFADLSFTFSVS